MIQADIRKKEIEIEIAYTNFIFLMLYDQV